MYRAHVHEYGGHVVRSTKRKLQSKSKHHVRLHWAWINNTKTGAKVTGRMYGTVHEYAVQRAFNHRLHSTSKSSYKYPYE